MILLTAEKKSLCAKQERNWQIKQHIAFNSKRVFEGVPALGGKYITNCSAAYISRPKSQTNPALYSLNLLVTSTANFALSFHHP